MTLEYYLMGLEDNNIWKPPTFFIKEDDGIMVEASDYIDEATEFTEIEAYCMRRYLQEYYGGYTWYLVKTNKKQNESNVPTEL